MGIKMSTIVTQKLQDDIKTLVNKFTLMRHEGLDLFNLYWKGGVKEDKDALAGGAAATLSTKLIKGNIIVGLAIAEQCSNFFDNIAVVTQDQMANCQVITHGNAATPALVSDRLEEFGERAKQFGIDSIAQFNLSKDIVNLYNSSELSAVIGSMSTYNVVYGSDMTKDQLTSAVNVCNDWISFMNNVAVSTADRKVTLGKWESL